MRKKIKKDFSDNAVFRDWLPYNTMCCFPKFTIIAQKKKKKKKKQKKNRKKTEKKQKKQKKKKKIFACE